MGGAMSSVTISGDTSGSIILQAPSVSGSTTLTLPTTSGTVLTNASSVTSSQLPAGSILQAVQSVKSNTQSFTTSTWTTPSGLSLSITPRSASSSILVMATVNYSMTQSWNSGALRLYRNETPIFVGDAAAGRTQVTTTLAYQTVEPQDQLMFTRTIQFIDTPSTTSAVSYSIRMADFDDGGGTIFINVCRGDATSVGRAASSIIAMEIAG